MSKIKRRRRHLRWCRYANHCRAVADNAAFAVALGPGFYRREGQFQARWEPYS